MRDRPVDLDVVQEASRDISGDLVQRFGEEAATGPRWLVALRSRSDAGLDRLVRRPVRMQTGVATDRQWSERHSFDLSILVAVQQRPIARVEEVKRVEQSVEQ